MSKNKQISRDHVIILSPQRILSETNYGGSVGGPDDLYFNELIHTFFISIKHSWCGNYGLQRYKDGLLHVTMPIN